MRLSNLYTEDLTLESGNIFKDLMHLVSRGASSARKTPGRKELRIKKLVREIYQEVWGDYSDNSKAAARIDSYANSILQHMPKFLEIDNEEQLRHEIEMLFRSRAERVPYSL